MKLDGRISRKSFLKGGVAMAAAMVLGNAVHSVSAAAGSRKTPSRQTGTDVGADNRHWPQYPSA